MHPARWFLPPHLVLDRLRLDEFADGPPAAPLHSLVPVLPFLPCLRDHVPRVVHAAPLLGEPPPHLAPPISHRAHRSDLEEVAVLGVTPRLR